MDYMFLWEKGYKSNTINNLGFKELNSGIREIGTKMSTAMENQKIVSYVFYPDGIVLFPYPRMSLGRHLAQPRKDVQR